jgi:hypothetical protein
MKYTPKLIFLSHEKEKVKSLFGDNNDQLTLFKKPRKDSPYEFVSKVTGKDRTQRNNVANKSSGYQSFDRRSQEMKNKKLKIRFQNIERFQHEHENKVTDHFFLMMKKR